MRPVTISGSGRSAGIGTKPSTGTPHRCAPTYSLSFTAGPRSRSGNPGCHSFNCRPRPRDSVAKPDWALQRRGKTRLAAERPPTPRMVGTGGQIYACSI